MPTSDTFSLTAFIVVRSLLALHNTGGRWQSLVNDEMAHYATLFTNQASSVSRLAAFIRNLPDRWFIWWMDYGNVYGMTLHFAMRKALIETTARKAIKEGATQIVILGAGFDSLALRLHQEFPTVTFFEIDHPATQQIKRETIGRDHTTQLRENIAFLPCDLSVAGALTRTLKETPFFDTRQKSLFIAEGLSMYLTDAQNRALFAETHALSALGSQIVFGALDSSRAKTPWLIRAILKARKESYRWTVTPQAINPWLKQNRYQLTGTYLCADLQKDFRSPAELNKLAKQAVENYYAAEVV